MIRVKSATTEFKIFNTFFYGINFNSLTAPNEAPSGDDVTITLYAVLAKEANTPRKNKDIDMTLLLFLPHKKIEKILR